MLFEEEVLLLLRLGLIVIMVPVVALVIYLMMKNRRQGYGWILSHLVLFSVGAVHLIKILEIRAFTSSEFNSLSFACIGVIWAISMFFFVRGLLDLSNRNRQINKEP